MWFSSPVLSDGIAEVIVSVMCDNTENFAVYVTQNTSSGTPSDSVPVPVSQQGLPFGYSLYYVAKATVQLDSDNFTVNVFNTDPSVDGLFTVSVRVVSRSA
jgi:hypothetical protein